MYGPLSRRVTELLHLPQELCKKCGKCCLVATFKGGLCYEEILALSKSTTEDPEQVAGAADFIKIFEPYESTDEARQFAPEFVNSIVKKTGKKPEEVYFFRCKYLGTDNLCKIHDSRPDLCKVYPLPLEQTYFNPGCGFEKLAKKNCKEIQEILESFKKEKNEVV